VKNAAYVGGYLLDLAAIPREWWPQNRVVLRLRPQRVRALRAGAPPAAEAATVPGPPQAVARAISRNRTGFLCWASGGSPLLAPVMWSADGEDVVAWLPSGGSRAPQGTVPGALVVESHHPFRATRMIGACLRGRLRQDTRAAALVGERYDAELPAGGTAVRLEVQRTTWWRGFEVSTARSARAAHTIAP